MLKGYFKADDEALAWGLFGAIVGAAGSTMIPSKKGGKGKMIKPGMAAALGAVGALGARAAFDPTLVNERKTTV